MEMATIPIPEDGSQSSDKEDGEEDTYYASDADDEEDDDEEEDSTIQTAREPNPPKSLLRTFYLLFCILSIEMSQRLPGIAATLVFYLKNGMNLESPIPTTVTLALNGKFWLGPHSTLLSPCGQMRACYESVFQYLL